MVSVNPVSVRALQDTLKLFKAQAPETPPTNTLVPTVEVFSGNSRSIIASLSAKLAEIKHGGSSEHALSSSASIHDQLSEKWRNMAARHLKDPATGPLNAAEKAQEKANFENYYNTIDEDILQNFDSLVVDLMLENSLYSDDPTFQAALTNGTLKVQHGEDVTSITIKPREVFYNSDGYNEGVAGAEVKWNDPFSVVEMRDDGRMYSKADGKNAGIGSINKFTFFVTW